MRVTLRHEGKMNSRLFPRAKGASSVNIGTGLALLSKHNARYEYCKILINFLKRLWESTKGRENEL